jgi:hypothetical protein
VKRPGSEMIKMTWICKKNEHKQNKFTAGQASVTMKQQFCLHSNCLDSDNANDINY